MRTQSDIDAAGDADLARHLRRYSRKLTMAITATLIVGALGLVYLASKRAGAFSETTGNYREIGAIS